jgi:hypothetical protein
MVSERHRQLGTGKKQKVAGKIYESQDRRQMKDPQAASGAAQNELLQPHTEITKSTRTVFGS